MCPFDRWNAFEFSGACAIELPSVRAVLAENPLSPATESYFEWKKRLEHDVNVCMDFLMDSMYMKMQAGATDNVRLELVLKQVITLES